MFLVVQFIRYMVSRLFGLYHKHGLVTANCKVSVLRSAVYAIKIMNSCSTWFRAYCALRQYSTIASSHRLVTKWDCKCTFFKFGNAIMPINHSCQISCVGKQNCTNKWPYCQTNPLPPLRASKSSYFDCNKTGLQFDFRKNEAGI